MGTVEALRLAVDAKDPYTKGFIWNVPNLEDYKGFLVDDETLHDDHKMYE